MFGAIEAEVVERMSKVMSCCMCKTIPMVLKCCGNCEAQIYCDNCYTILQQYADDRTVNTKFKCLNCNEKSFELIEFPDQLLVKVISFFNQHRFDNENVSENLEFIKKFKDFEQNVSGGTAGLEAMM